MTRSYADAIYLMICLMVITIPSTSALTIDRNDWSNMTRSIPQTDNAGSVSTTVKMAIIAAGVLATAAAYVVVPLTTAGYLAGVPLLEEMCNTASKYITINRVQGVAPVVTVVMSGWFAWEENAKGQQMVEVIKNANQTLVLAKETLVSAKNASQHTAQQLQQTVQQLHFTAEQLEMANNQVVVANSGAKRCMETKRGESVKCQSVQRAYLRELNAIRKSSINRSNPVPDQYSEEVNDKECPVESEEVIDNECPVESKNIIEANIIEANALAQSKIDKLALTVKTLSDGRQEDKELVITLREQIRTLHKANVLYNETNHNLTETNHNLTMTMEEMISHMLTFNQSNVTKIFILVAVFHITILSMLVMNGILRCQVQDANVATAPYQDTVAAYLHSYCKQEDNITQCYILSHLIAARKQQGKTLSGLWQRLYKKFVADEQSEEMCNMQMEKQSLTMSFLNKKNEAEKMILKRFLRYFEKYEQDWDLPPMKWNPETVYETLDKCWENPRFRTMARNRYGRAVVVLLDQANPWNKLVRMLSSRLYVETIITIIQAMERGRRDRAKKKAQKQGGMAGMGE